MYVDFSKFLRIVCSIIGFGFVAFGTVVFFLSQNVAEQSSGLLSMIFGLQTIWYVSWLVSKQKDKAPSKGPSFRP